MTAFRIENSGGASATLISYGAAVQSLKVPDRAGNLTDVVLGYDTAAEYETNDGFLGAVMGRVGNRIGGAEFSLNGTVYHLPANNNGNCLHGGIRGFNKRMWEGEACADGCSVAFTRVSPDGEEGFPGNLTVRVTYTLTGMEAAVLYAPGTGIRMRVFTEMPGMQLYTSNFLPPRPCKGGQVSGYRDAAALETQLFPNGMNCYGFPSPVLRAGRHLQSETVYAFSAE